jgi:hypothetical protein
MLPIPKWRDKDAVLSFTSGSGIGKVATDPEQRA